MWRMQGALSTRTIPQIGAPIAQVGGGSSSMGRLANVSNFRQIETFFPLTERVEIPAPDIQGDRRVFRIDLSAYNFSAISMASAGRDDFVNAQDAERPDVGEFSYNPYTRMLRLVDDRRTSLRRGMKIKIVGYSIVRELRPDTSSSGGGGTQVIQANRGPEFKTNVVPSPYPAWLLKIPGVAQFSWTQNFEDHPSGSLQIEADASNAESILSNFKIGTKLTAYGLTLVVESYSQNYDSISEYQKGRVQLSFSLTGVWKKSAETQVPASENDTGDEREETDEDGTDPECVKAEGRSSGLGGYGGGGGSVNLIALARRAGANLSVPGGTSGSRLWNVAIPQNAGRTSTLNWNNELQARSRSVNGRIDYSNPRRVHVARLWEGNSWIYAEDQIISCSHSVQGNLQAMNDTTVAQLPPASTWRQPASSGQIRNELTSRFPTASFGTVGISMGGGNSRGVPNPPPEPTRERKPTWKRKPDKVITLATGDIDVESPPVGLSWLKTMDLNYSQSGPTKEVTITTTVNGTVMRTIKQRYGLVYLGINIVWGETGELRGFAPGRWTMVMEEETESFFDDETGYYLGSNTIGWEKRQLKTEDSTNPETLEFGSVMDPIEAAIRNLYDYMKVPIRGGHRVLLNAYRLWYRDAREEPPYESYKVCNPNGTSRMAYVIDPTWVEPMFVIQELMQRDSFAWRRNPESTPEAPLPPYTTGEETSERKRLEIFPAADIDSNLLTITNVNVDRYTEYVYHSTAGNSGFREAAEDGTFSQMEGRPGSANRRQTIWERVDPEEPETEEDSSPDDTTDEYEYTARSSSSEEGSADGNTGAGRVLVIPRPVGSRSYPFASTTQEVQQTAEAELNVEDIKTVQTNLQIPFNRKIKAGDYFNFTLYGVAYYRRVLSVTNTLIFDGEISTNRPLVYSMGTDLNLGLSFPGSIRSRRGRPTVTVNRQRKPKKPKPPKPDPGPEETPPNTPSGPLVLGSLNLDIVSRRTFGGEP